MGLFGFGKKKDTQPAPAPKQDQTQNNKFSSSNLMNQFGIHNMTQEQLQNSIKETAAKNTSKVWSESVDNFLARNDNAKLVKLTGKPDDLAFYEVGNRCHVEQDFENEEKYDVTCGGVTIGRLPASAIAYAEAHDLDPEHLAVIIAEVEYDIEKGRDIISVYISE